MYVCCPADPGPDIEMPNALKGQVIAEVDKELAMVGGVAEWLAEFVA